MEEPSHSLFSQSSEPLEDNVFFLTPNQVDSSGEDSALAIVEALQGAHKDAPIGPSSGSKKPGEGSKWRDALHRIPRTSRPP